MRGKIKNKLLNIIKSVKKIYFKCIEKLKKIFTKMFRILKCIAIFFIKYFGIPGVFFLVFLVLPIIFEYIIDFLVVKNVINDKFDSGYLDFYGTILSGIFTLIGVVITIKHENNVKKQEETITYKPILALDGVNKKVSCMTREVGLGMGFSSSNFDPDRERKCEEFFEQQRNNNPKYRLYIKNNGRGETFNAVLDDFEVASVNWDSDSHLGSNYSTPQYIGEILKDGYIGIDVNLPDYLFMPEEMKGVLWYELRTNTFISYSDMFDRIRYQYRIHAVHKVKIEKFEDEDPYHYKNAFRYAKVRYELDHLIPEMKIYSKKQKKFIHEHKYVMEKLKNNALY